MRRVLHTVPIVAICAWTAALNAQEVALDGFSGIGARAMGMGGAYVTVSDDFSGLFWNPAGLARARRGSISWGMSHDRYRNESQFFSRASAFELNSTRFAAGGIVYPIPVYRGSLVVAGGFGRVRHFDGGLRIDAYDEVAEFDKSGFSEDRGTFGAWTMGAAIDLAPRLSAGISLYKWRGTNRFMQELTLEDVRQVHVDTVRIYQRFESDDSFSALGVQGGIHYWHPSNFRLGFTVSAATPIRVSAELVDEFEDTFDDRKDTYPRDNYADRYEIRQPVSLGFGLGWSSKGLTLSGDVHYGDLQEATYNVLARNITPYVDDFRQQYRSAVRVHLGGEYAIPGRGVALRAGYYRDPVRYVGGGPVPEVRIETDRDAWTLGIGAELDRYFTLDLAAVIGGYKQTEGNREDRVRTIRALVSMRVNFDAEAYW